MNIRASVTHTENTSIIYNKLTFGFRSSLLFLYQVIIAAGLDPVETQITSYGLSAVSGASELNSSTVSGRTAKKKTMNK